MSKRTEPEDGRNDFNATTEDPTSAAKIRKIESQDSNHEQPNPSHSSLRSDETARMDSDSDAQDDRRDRNWNNRSPRDTQPIEQKVQEGGGENNKQRHAMDFLVKVKSHYADSPSVYNQFLEIMKDFKSARIDTPDVIIQVKELFYGHNNLILEFNSFLPPGYRIDVDPEPEPAATTPQQPVLPQQPTTQADLEHARNYVRKIKNRFALQPQIYKQFLEILHCYYQGQYLINEVLGEVGELFASHADLLEEFKLFLPRAVADQGNQSKNKKPKPAPPPPPPKRQVTERRKPASEVEMLTMSLPERRRLPEREKRPNFEDKKREDISLPIRRLPKTPFINPVQEYGYYTEKSFFQAVRERLGNNLLYQEFLKSIDLLSQEIITKSELVLLVKELLVEHKDLFHSFKNFIGIKDKEEKEEEKEEEEEEEEENSKKKKRMEYEIVGVSVEEEERCQLELFLDLNQSTMRALDMLMDASYVTNTPPLPETLDVLHIRNIERVYGDRSSELIEALFVNPLAAIPVIQKRLRQKNQEWTNAKKSLLNKNEETAPSQAVTVK